MIQFASLYTLSDRVGMVAYAYKAKEKEKEETSVVIVITIVHVIVVVNNFKTRRESKIVEVSVIVRAS